MGEIKLEDMKQVRNLVDAEPICYNEDCKYFGSFEPCYTHLHAYCEIFQGWYMIRLNRIDIVGE